MNDNSEFNAKIGALLRKFLELEWISEDPRTLDNINIQNMCKEGKREIAQQIWKLSNI